MSLQLERRCYLVVRLGLGLRLLVSDMACISSVCGSSTFFLHTVRSFVELVRYVFTLPDVSVFLSNKICQDPLENFFGEQRQRGRVNENPTARDFCKNTQALRVINGTCRNVRGNCRGAASSQRLSDESLSAPLPKRKRYHK